MTASLVPLRSHNIISYNNYCVGVWSADSAFLRGPRSGWPVLGTAVSQVWSSLQVSWWVESLYCEFASRLSHVQSLEIRSDQPEASISHTTSTNTIQLWLVRLTKSGFWQTNHSIQCSTSTHTHLHTHIYACISTHTHLRAHLHTHTSTHAQINHSRSSILRCTAMNECWVSTSAGRSHWLELSLVSSLLPSFRPCSVLSLCCIASLSVSLSAGSQQDVHPIQWYVHSTNFLL